MTATAAGERAQRPVDLADEHSVLLWQVAAYADDVVDAAAGRSRPIAASLDALLSFLHLRVLPYLGEEEERLAAGDLRHERLARVMRADHEEIRADVENVAGSRTRDLLSIAAQALVRQLDRHARREEYWVAGQAGRNDQVVDWALPLVLQPRIDVDALPPRDRDRLLLRRLSSMRPGETVRLSSSRDLHSLWLRQQVWDPEAHLWVYEQAGPRSWQVRVTRRPRPPS